MIIKKDMIEKRPLKISSLIWEDRVKKIYQNDRTRNTLKKITVLNGKM